VPLLVPVVEEEATRIDMQEVVAEERMIVVEEATDLLWLLRPHGLITRRSSVAVDMMVVRMILGQAGVRGGKDFRVVLELAEGLDCLVAPEDPDDYS